MQLRLRRGDTAAALRLHGIADGSKALRAALHSLPRALHGLTGRKTFYLIIAYPAAILYIILNILL